MVTGRVAADNEHQVGALDVGQRDGGGAGADGAGESDTAGLMAVVAAIIDVVGAVQSGKKLQEKPGLVRAYSGVHRRRGNPDRLLRRHQSHPMAPRLAGGGGLPRNQQFRGHRSQHPTDPFEGWPSGLDLSVIF